MSSSEESYTGNMSQFLLVLWVKLVDKFVYCRPMSALMKVCLDEGPLQQMSTSPLLYAKFRDCEGGAHKGRVEVKILEHFF